MRRLRSRISLHDSAERLRSLGVDVFFGQGRFVSQDAVEVEGRTLRFRKAVIATGARAVHPPVPGLVEAGFLTNETVFSLTERPPRLAVFGAGPLGCELAQAFRRLGSEVTIIERHGQFLAREDPDAAKNPRRIVPPRRHPNPPEHRRPARRADRGGQALHTATEGRAEILVVDEILVGAGRAPNVEDLGLERVGVRFDTRAGVLVNDRLQTTNPRIYAAGDVCLKHKFTHTADASARIVIQNALFWGRKKFSALTVPWCTYTDPEIAHVGLYERDAEEQGIAVATFSVPLEDVDRAVADGETEGFVKVHVRKGTDRILGATIVARHAGEMISEISLAMVAGVGLRTIAAVIHPYPTQAEGIKRAADAYNRTRLTPFWKGVFAKVMAWQR